MTAGASSPGEGRDLDEPLGLILEELKLAIRWGRPSIVLVVYVAEAIRQQAEVFLERQLCAIGQRVQHLEVSPEQDDVAWRLAQRSDREQTVFFVSGLRWGGGRNGGNAYRALNLRRELFVEYGLRVVFWLTTQEAAELPRRAPDFWAFRHRVIELPGSIAQPLVDNSIPVRPAMAKEAIAWRESMLASLPDMPEAQVTRLTLLLELASLYRRGGDQARALRLARQGIELAERLGDQKQQARAWREIGLAELAEDHLEAALEACLRAVQLDAEDPSAWESLGVVHLALGQSEAAIEAWQRSLAIHPGLASAWAGLGDAYRAQGRLEEARLAYRKATHLAPERAAYWERLGETLHEAGKVKAALSPLRRAIRLDERRTRAWELLARAYQQLGRPRAAAQALRRLEALRQPSQTADVTEVVNNPGG